MFKYEIVSIEVDSRYANKVAQKMNEEIDKRPYSRLVNQEVILGTSMWGYGSTTKAILLTFETKGEA